jgi:hypothetical protein
MRDPTAVLQCILFVIFLMIVTSILLWKTKQKSKLPSPVPSARYEIRPFEVKGDFFTFEEFRELLKVINAGSDNGLGLWANADGLWFDLMFDEYAHVDPHEVRKGERPEPFFTHIMYYGK